MPYNNNPINKKGWKTEFTCFIESMRKIDANAACWLEESAAVKNKFKTNRVKHMRNGRVDLSTLFSWSGGSKDYNYWLALFEKCRDLRPEGEDNGTMA